MIIVHLLNPFLDLLYKHFFLRLTTEPPFCWGVIWGLGIALVFGLFGRFYLWFRGAWKRFFNPGKGPATVNTPSGFLNMVGCMRAVIITILLLSSMVFIFLLADLPFFG